MPDLLSIEHLSAGYGEAVVLSDISLSLAEGQALALLGRNGMGKTTLINTIVGVTHYFSGKIALDGVDITRLRPDQRAHAGIGWVPQERNIFKSLTVHENLTAVALPGRWTTDKIYTLFPRLNERRQNLGNQLSGGEQQMLAVARALVLNPRVLLLDEPLEGLAPIIVDELLAALRRIIGDEGMSAILVEQNAKKILGVTDHAIIIERGAVVHAADSATLLNDRSALEIHASTAPPWRASSLADYSIYGERREKRLIRVAANHSGKNRQHDNAQIEKEAPILQVIQIVLQTFLYGSVAAPSIYLRPTRNSGFQPVAVVIASYVVKEFLNEVRPLRPRAYHAHFTLQDINKLRQFIQACLP